MNVPLFISTLFEPMIVLFVLAVLGGIRAGLAGIDLISYIAYLLAMTGATWYLRVRFMRSLRTNWDVSDRVKRVRLLVLLLAFFFLVFLSILLWKNYLLTQVFGLFLVWLIGFFLITLRIKISGHMGLLTLALGMILGWYGIAWLPIVLVLPLVAWSRLVLKRHTMREVIGGVCYSIVLLSLAHLFTT